mmetsp:Transcript_19677/g.46017  ORF Transcript_19677/g.46017 Transcript_19677/m.46017 type:complete len:330 (+) Transcript_19677:2367-3356(+)
MANNGVLLSHATGAQGKAGGHDGRKTFRNRSDGKSDSDLEIVDGTTEPASLVLGEMIDVDEPHKDADDHDDIGEEVTESVKLQLEGGGLLLSLSEALVEPADEGVLASEDDNTASFAVHDIGTGEENVLLVSQVSRSRDRLSLLVDGRRLASESHLLSLDSRAVELHNADVGRDLVTGSNLDNVSRDKLDGLDGDHLTITAALGVGSSVLLQGLNGLVGVGLLPDANNSIANKNKHDHESFHKLAGPESNQERADKIARIHCATHRLLQSQNKRNEGCRQQDLHKLVIELFEKPLPEWGALLFRKLVAAVFLQPAAGIARAQPRVWVHL